MWRVYKIWVDFKTYIHSSSWIRNQWQRASALGPVLSPTHLYLHIQELKQNPTQQCPPLLIQEMSLPVWMPPRCHVYYLMAMMASGPPPLETSRVSFLIWRAEVSEYISFINLLVMSAPVIYTSEALSFTWTPSIAETVLGLMTTVRPHVKNGSKQVKSHLSSLWMYESKNNSGNQCIWAWWQRPATSVLLEKSQRDQENSRPAWATEQDPQQPQPKGLELEAAL